MKINNKTSSLIILVLLGAGAISLTLMQAPSLPEPKQPVPVGADENISKNENKNTIAQAWRWEEIEADKKNNLKSNSAPAVKPEINTVDEIPFDVVFIYEALQNVKLDENKNVVLDHDALSALNAAIDENVLALNQKDLDKLQTLIKIALPGKPGEQTARVVGDYFNYSLAKKEFDQIYPANKDLQKNMQAYRTQYNELLALRNLYLGEDVAQRLFEQEDLDAEYMFATMSQRSSDSAQSDGQEAQPLQQ